jgi:hypothetical protein
MDVADIRARDEYHEEAVGVGSDRCHPFGRRFLVLDLAHQHLRDDHCRVARLLAENIPPGTHIDDVTAWIHSQPFPGSPALPFVKVGDRDRKPRPVSGAMLGNANVDLIFPGRIILKFHYDKDDRLVSYEMETQVLMP